MPFLKGAFFPAFLIIGLGVLGCGAVESAGPSPSPSGSSSPQSAQSEELKTVALTPAQAQRLQGIMTPLIEHMNRPLPKEQVKITILADPELNAANAGGGDFYITSGLLEKATDNQLRGVLAHETAHADLGHVAKQQRLGLGLQLGAVLLDRILPGSGQLAPIAGQIASNAYSRREEYEADAHGVEILDRAGFDGKGMMANTLGWIAQSEGTGGGGFFATHPATGDRIEAVQRLP
jgi:predicted Zn-dependent protease